MVQRLDELLQSCTVKITVPGQMGWGTGFFVAPGLILTCAHVVKALNPGAFAQFSWQQEGFTDAEIVECIHELDLALLRFSPPHNVNLPCVYLDREFQPTDNFYTYGYPDSFPDGASVTSQCEGDARENGVPLILFKSGLIRPGFSGSPLLNLRTGKVCGIVKFTRDRSIDLGGGAVPAAVILAQFPELVEQQRSFHQHDQRWSQRMRSPLASNLGNSPATRAALSLSAYDAQTWVGREESITDLTQKLEAGWRIIALIGITGIGKTALAERLVVEMQGQDVPFHRLNFDDRGQRRDFLGGALALLSKLGEVVTIEDQKDPQNALRHLLQALRTKQFLVQVDSVELLLESDEERGWNTFKDNLWIDFFQQLLAGEACQSQLLLTSQAGLEELQEIGYPRFLHLESVGGLSEDEQLELFRKHGLNPDAAGTETLKRLGRLYDGHPLVIRVMAKDILGKPFNGNVRHYWQRHQTEFDEGERTKQKGNSSRALQIMIKSRVEQSLKRLPTNAYQMLCRSAVYRRPVSERFWLAMVENLSEDKKGAALELLKSRNLVEEEFRPDGVLLLRQHNLVKSVARQLLRAEEAVWQQAERTAARLWLEDYEPEPDAPNLEQVRGQLEAFHHFCSLKDWEKASNLVLAPSKADAKSKLSVQLCMWGYYQEAKYLCKELLEQSDKLPLQTNIILRQSLGDAYNMLCDFSEATKCYEQVLEIARDIGDLVAEGNALGSLGDINHWQCKYEEAIDNHKKHLEIAKRVSDFNGVSKAFYNLGNTYNYLGDYHQCIKYSNRALSIAEKMGDSYRQADVFGNLGIAYRWLGNYSRAKEFHQKQLDVAREIGYRHAEGFALGCFGLTYHQLGDYQQAIDYHNRHLEIAREVGDLFAIENAQANLAKAYTCLCRYSEAESYFRECLEIANQINDRDGEAGALAGIGIIFFNKELCLESLGYLQKALEICREIRSRDNEANVLYALAKVYKKLQQKQLALDNCQEAFRISTELSIPLLKECEELQAMLAAGGQQHEG